LNLLSSEHLDNVQNFLKFYQTQNADIDSRLTDVNARITGKSFYFRFLFPLVALAAVAISRLLPTSHVPIPYSSLENRKTGAQIRGEVGAFSRKQNEKINEVVIEVNAAEKSQARAFFFPCGTWR
jgi:hypothetical protein